MIELGPDSVDKKVSDFSSFRQDLEARLSEMRIIREPYLNVWKQSADLVMPQKSSSIYDTANRDKSKDADKPYISDETPMLALSRLSAGMLSGVTSPIKPWFKWSAGSKLDDNPKIKTWLEGYETVVQTVLHRSNFYDSSIHLYDDMEVIGTGVSLIYEDYKDVAIFRNVDAGQYFLAQDNRGETTVLYREFFMTVHQLVREYGINNVSQDVARKFYDKRGLQDDVLVYQAIQLNDDFQKGKIGHKGNEYIDVHWEANATREARPLRFKGFKEKPFTAPPWRSMSNRPYGISPTEMSISAIRELYHLKERMGQGIDKAYHGAMMLNDSLKDDPSVFLAGGIVFGKLSNGPLAQPVFSNPPDPQRLMPFIESAYRRIEKAYFGDLFMMLANMEGVQPRNQLEITERKGEKILMLSPTLQSIHNNYSKIVLNRVGRIVLRSGLVPPPPQELQGTELEVEYISDLAMAQKAVATSGIEQFMVWSANMINVFPELRYKINAFQAANDYSKYLGISPKIIRSDEEATEQTNQQNQQMEQQQAMEQGVALTQGAKNLADMNVGGGQDALAMMMQGGV
ncbi:head to tail connecting protein [Caudoviricetes sp.]|nr:head to tail connecting protein [Caudoviricetes sp.]